MLISLLQRYSMQLMCLDTVFALTCEGTAGDGKDNQPQVSSERKLDQVSITASATSSCMSCVEL